MGIGVAVAVGVDVGVAVNVGAGEGVMVAVTMCIEVCVGIIVGKGVGVLVQAVSASKKSKDKLFVTVRFHSIICGIIVLAEKYSRSTLSTISPISRGKR